MKGINEYFYYTHLFQYLLVRGLQTGVEMFNGLDLAQYGGASLRGGLPMKKEKKHYQSILFR